MSSQIQEKIFCLEEAIWAVDDHYHGNFTNCTALLDYKAIDTQLKPLCD